MKTSFIRGKKDRICTIESRDGSHISRKTIVIQHIEEKSLSRTVLCEKDNIYLSYERGERKRRSTMMSHLNSPIVRFETIFNICLIPFSFLRFCMTHSVSTAYFYSFSNISRYWLFLLIRRFRRLIFRRTTIYINIKCFYIQNMIRSQLVSLLYHNQKNLSKTISIMYYQILLIAIFLVLLLALGMARDLHNAQVSDEGEDLTAFSRRVMETLDQKRDLERRPAIRQIWSHRVKRVCLLRISKWMGKINKGYYKFISSTIT